ncbi:MAG: MFS transporter, partial [Thaumarchaeota archaeon]|nr:MFS transporter [Nitrososphaerota archaeon]
MSSRSRLPFISLYSIFTAIRGVSGLILPLYFVSVGIPDLQVGISIGFFGASLLIFEILWGVVFDRMGPGRLIFASTALSVATYLLLPFVRNAEGAIVAEFLLGASGPILAVVARSLVIRRSESSSWAGGFGLLGAIYAMAQVVGSLIASLTSPAIGFGDTFYLAAAATILVYLVYLRWSRRTGSWAGLGDLAAIPTKDEPRPPLDWRGLPLLALVAVPTFIGYSFFVNIMQLVVTQTPSISATEFQAGVVIASFWVANAIFQPVFSARVARRSRLVIGIALAANFGVFALLVPLHNVWEIAVAGLLEGVCISAISPLSLSLLMVGIPKRYAGRAMGIYGAAEDVGVILGPLVGSAVWVQFGLTSAYLTL